MKTSFFLLNKKRRRSKSNKQSASMALFFFPVITTIVRLNACPCKSPVCGSTKCVKESLKLRKPRKRKLIEMVIFFCVERNYLNAVVKFFLVVNLGREILETNRFVLWTTLPGPTPITRKRTQNWTRSFYVFSHFYVLSAMKNCTKFRIVKRHFYFNVGNRLRQVWCVYNSPLYKQEEDRNCFWDCYWG